MGVLEEVREAALYGCSHLSGMGGDAEGACCSRLRGTLLWVWRHRGGGVLFAGYALVATGAGLVLTGGGMAAASAGDGEREAAARMLLSMSILLLAAHLAPSLFLPFEGPSVALLSIGRALAADVSAYLLVFAYAIAVAFGALHVLADPAHADYSTAVAAAVAAAVSPSRAAASTSASASASGASASGASAPPPLASHLDAWYDALASHIEVPLQLHAGGLELPLSAGLLWRGDRPLESSERVLKVAVYYAYAALASVLLACVLTAALSHAHARRRSEATLMYRVAFARHVLRLELTARLFGMQTEAGTLTPPEFGGRGGGGGGGGGGDRSGGAEENAGPAQPYYAYTFCAIAAAGGGGEDGEGVDAGFIPGSSAALAAASADPFAPPSAIQPGHGSGQEERIEGVEAKLEEILRVLSQRAAAGDDCEGSVAVIDGGGDANGKAGNEAAAQGDAGKAEAKTAEDAKAAGAQTPTSPGSSGGSDGGSGAGSGFSFFFRPAEPPPPPPPEPEAPPSPTSVALRSEATAARVGKGHDGVMRRLRPQIALNPNQFPNGATGQLSGTRSTGRPGSPDQGSPGKGSPGPSSPDADRAEGGDSARWQPLVVMPGGQPRPSFRQVPPSFRQVPPSSRQVPPSSRQVPPSFRQGQPPPSSSRSPRKSGMLTPRAAPYSPMLYRDTALHAMVQELRRDIGRLASLYEDQAASAPHEPGGGREREGGGGSERGRGEGAIHTSSEVADGRGGSLAA